MDNITIITDAQGKEHVLEEFAPNEFRSTPKEIWDEQQSQQQSILGGN